MIETPLVNQKSLLAKLMAGENITIYHENISTAYFDVKERALHCPIFNNCSSELYDLLMGHEIGHCLFTPPEGWHDAVHSNCSKEHVHTKDCWSKKFHYFLNVCEDARIERLIKSKYPGLKSSFIKGYENLFHRGFFGVDPDRDLNYLNLIDRINLHYKIGSHLMLKFSDDEKIFLDRLDTAESFSEIKKIAQDLFDLAKIQKEQDQKAEKRFQRNLTIKNESDSVDEDYKAGYGKQETENYNDGDIDPTSITDEAFRIKEKSLGSTRQRPIVNITLPTPNLGEIILPTESIVEKYEEDCKFYDKQYKEQADQCVKFFRDKNLPFIRLLLQEFEVQKNATQYRREDIRRLGDLDMTRLAEYRFTNDLFKRVKETPKGKSHGLIKFLDMSGSMEGLSLYNAIEQLLVLIWFCEMARIPYDVYGFNDLNESRNNLFSTGPRDAVPSLIKLNNLISSKLSKSLKTRAIAVLAHVSIRSLCRRPTHCPAIFSKVRHLIPTANKISESAGGMSLGGTPLVETIMASRTIIEKFKNSQNLDIVNVIYLTDGAGASNLKMTDTVANDVTRQNQNVGQTYKIYPGSVIEHFDVFITDPKTKKQIFIRNSNPKDLQACMFKFVQDLTGCRHIGFYICDELDLGVSKDAGFKISKEEGFDTYYYVSNRLMNGVIDKKESTKDLLDLFNSHQTKMRTSRFILSKFAKEIGQRL